MSTLFYLSSTVTGSVSPNYSNVWTNVKQADRRIAGTGKSLSVLTDKIYPRLGDFTGDKYILSRQYITNQFPAQTLSGTVNGQLMTKEYSSGDNCFGVVIVNVVNSTGAFVSNLYSGKSVTEYSTVKTNKFAPITGNINTTVLPSGNYRLVFEYGVYSFEAGVTGTINTFGDNAGNNLPVNETYTSSGNPWIQFSKTVQF